MPRPNKDRQVPHEAYLAQRIKLERERRGLTFERLADKMTDAGCAMAGSAIFKIENNDPPRRITLNEAVTFAQVFGMKLQELLVPPAIAASREAVSLWAKHEKVSEDYLKAGRELFDLEARIVELIETDDEVREALVRQYGDDADSHIGNMVFMHRDERMRGIYGRDLPTKET